MVQTVKATSGSLTDPTELMHEMRVLDWNIASKKCHRPKTCPVKRSSQRSRQKQCTCLTAECGQHCWSVTVNWGWGLLVFSR